jgi:hypothetical protein
MKNKKTKTIIERKNELLIFLSEGEFNKNQPAIQAGFLIKKSSFKS